MARRAPTIDPLLAKLRSEVATRLARGRKLLVPRRARFIVGDLGVLGKIADLGPGGVFLVSDVLVEAGERGVLTVDVGVDPGVPVKASFCRTASDDEAGGMGLAFEPGDQDTELRTLDLIVRILDADVEKK